ncbi:MAG: hypothetical protein Q9162_007454 [Coniocarpon cinnabarinum]
MASVTSLDHDMRRLRMERYTPSAANEVKIWMEQILGEKIEGDLLNALKDGVALLVNLALPPPGIRYKASNMPFTQRENISQFLTACEKAPFNMPSHDRFLTVDLYDEKDPTQVIQCLAAFSRVANTLNPMRFPTTIGPKRGAPSPTRKTAEGGSHNTSTPSRPGRGFSNVSNASFGSPSPIAATKSPPVGNNMSPTPSAGSPDLRTPESMSRSGSMISSWSKKGDEGSTAPAWNIHQYGYLGGASQGNQGVVFGAPRQITSPSVNVPTAAEKQARLRQQEREAEAEAKRRREEEESRARERKAQIEAEEQAAREEEHRAWEEETRKAKQRAEEDAERERQALERERETLRKVRERELQEVERDKEERRRREEQRRAEEEQARKEAERVRKSSAHVSPPRQSSSENQRIKELERQLAEAKERERQWKKRQEESRSPPQTHSSHDEPNESPDQSFTAGDDEQFENKTASASASVPSTAPASQQIPMRSGGPRPLPTAPKPRNYPFTRPKKTLEPAQAEVRPPAPLSATAEPPADDTKPSTYASSRPAHVTRTDKFLATNPAPLESKPTSHQSEEMGMSSTSEGAAEDARRAQVQQKTKAGEWASKSLLEREMEKERERQREWEEEQMGKARQGFNGRGECTDYMRLFRHAISTDMTRDHGTEGYGK